VINSDIKEEYLSLLPQYQGYALTAMIHSWTRRLRQSCKPECLLIPLFVLFATELILFLHIVSYNSKVGHENWCTYRLQLFVSRAHFSKAYLGRDHPQKWQIGELKDVTMRLEETIRYQMSGDEAEREWGALLPPGGGGYIYLGPERQRFTIGLFHQMRCLSIIRSTIARSSNQTLATAAEEEPADARHCFNYLRQIIRCNANLRLESTANIFVSASTLPHMEYRCKDWRVPYREAEKNFEEYQQWLKASSSSSVSGTHHF